MSALTSIEHWLSHRVAVGDLRLPDDIHEGMGILALARDLDRVITPRRVLDPKGASAS